MNSKVKVLLQKKVLLPVCAVLVAAGTLIVGGNFVHASGTNAMSGLAQAIASKYNLNETDVQSVITAYMQQHMNMKQNPQQREKNRLDQLVKQGKITSAQETAILAELASLQSQYSFATLKTMTQPERQQALLNEKNTLVSWANSQGINQLYVIPFGPMVRRNWHRVSPTPTP